MSDLSDYAREVQAASDSSWRKQEAVIKDLKCRIEELEGQLINAGSALELCIDMLEALQEESGRSIEYGEEDAFRMGEWFEAYELKCLGLARDTLAKIKGEQP